MALFDNPGAYEGPNWKPSWQIEEPPEKPKASLAATRCSEITERKVDWLWKGYIPRSSLTLLEGPPKAGKSTVLADIIARVSVGGDMPDKQPLASAGAVLMLSDEDSAAHVVVPRLRVAGALLDAVRVVKAVDPEGRPRKFIIGAEDTALLEREIAEAGALMVVVDPLSVYMGAADSHREQDVRQVLWHLSDLAERTGCAVLCVRHWNKNRTGDALTQGGGSVGFSAAARSILSVDRAPDDKSARVLAVGYSNYATDYPSLGFRLESVPEEDVARVQWTGISRHDADSLAAPRLTGNDTGALGDASDFLHDFLEDGPKPSREVYTAADANGFTRITVRRAMKATRIVASKVGLNGGWSWSLPEDAHGNEHDHLRRYSSPNDHLRENGDLQ